MAVRAIPQIGDPVLRIPTADVTDFEDQAFQTLVDDMIETMRDAGGAGIAANQIGVSSVSSATSDTRTSLPSR